MLPSWQSRAKRGFARSTASHSDSPEVGVQLTLNAAQPHRQLLGANFSGGDADFRDANFSGGYVGFTRATFSRGSVSFERATFSGGTIAFENAQFSGMAAVGAGWDVTTAPRRASRGPADGWSAAERGG
jgi:Pentapeptide repeats (9 copies)